MSVYATIGYLRDPETKEFFYPWTHYSSVHGLDAHVLELIGGSVSDYIPLTGSSAITGSLVPSTSNSISLGSASKIWQYVYANTISASSVGTTSLSTTNFTFGGVTQYATTVQHQLNGASGDSSTLGTFITATNGNIQLPKFYAPTEAGDSTNKYLYWDSTSKPVWGALTDMLSGGSTSQILLQNGDTITAGTSGYLLTANGSSSKPSWTNKSDINLTSFNNNWSTLGTITVNNSAYGNIMLKSAWASNPAFYAPTGGGTANQLLISQGSTSAPTWLTLSGDGYLKYSTDNGWSVDTPITTVYDFSIKNSGDTIHTYSPTTNATHYVDISMTHYGGGATTQESSSATNKAGIKITDGTNTYYQKISVSALINDSDSTQELILNGNFN